MSSGKTKSEKVICQDLPLVNNFELPKGKGDLKKKINNVKGLGFVSIHEYSYNDICPNAMK